MEVVERAIREWQAGVHREENFRSLFERYYRPLFRFFSKRGCSPDEGCELTQDTFLRVFQGISEFRHDAPFEAWLFQIATNAYRNSRRSASTLKRSGQLVEWEEGLERLPGCHVGPQPRATAEPLDLLLQAERRQILREEIGALPMQMRRCLVLRLYQDRTYEEIAFVLRVSIETVKAHLFQARRRLRARLARELESNV